MAKPRTPNQKKAYAALKGRLNQYSYLVQTVYDTLNAEAARLALSTGYTGEREFRWSDYPQTQKRVADLQARFVGDIGSVVYAGTSREWKESNIMQDLLATKALKSYRAQVNGRRVKVYYQPNNDAMKAFQERADRGMNLSAKLWNQSGNYKQELEYAISAAIEKGMSAVTLSKRVSRYLNDFPALKADYKERYGHAVECFDCEYRSIRLARTEINMAYRTAEQKRWQQFDFVLGYEIKLSGSHPVTDICDELKGRYPKDFHFVGWHPACMCYCVPILKTEDEFWADDDEPSVNAVADVPQNFKDWVVENEDKIAKAKERGTLPYWVRDNEGYVGVKNVTKGNHASREEKADVTGEKDNSISGISASEKALIAEESVAVKHDVQEIFQGKDFVKVKDINDILDKINENLPAGEKWFVNGKPSISITLDTEVNGKTYRDGRILLRVKRLERVKSALRKIAQGQVSEISEKEADTMATLWHEIVHNRHVGLDSSGEIHSESKRCMELANEWYARHNLKVFYGHLGLDKVPYPEFITHRKSTAYDQMVKNYDHVIGIMRLDRKKVMSSLENSLFNGSYDDLENGLYKALKDGGMKNLNDMVLPEEQAKELLTFVLKSTPTDITDWLIENNYLVPN